MHTFKYSEVRDQVANVNSSRVIIIKINWILENGSRATEIVIWMLNVSQKKYFSDMYEIKTIQSV